MKFIFPAVLAATLALLSPAVLAEEMVDRARQQIAAGNAVAAYDALAPLEFKRAGEVDFDYVLGIAALQSGRPGLAIMAFERVLAVDPEFVAAHLDIGRAYYALNDFERAEQAFAVVRSKSPPPAALATVANYEKAIAAKRDPSRLRLTGYLEASAGTDSNVNQATNRNSIAIPAFGGTYALSSASQARRDDYGAVTVGGEAQMGVGEKTTLFAATDMQLRDYGKLHPYDIGYGDFRGGLIHSDGRDLYRASLGYNDYRMESERYRGVASANGEWRHALGENTVASFSAQYNEIRYVPDSLRGNDVNVVLLAGGVTQLLPAATRLVIEGGGFAGSEREERRRTDGNRWLGGLRVGALAAMNNELDVFASLSAQVSLYDRYNTLFVVRRRDAQYDLGLGANWKFAPLWSLRPQVALSRSDSNLAIYDTLRYDLSLSLRRDFR